MFRRFVVKLCSANQSARSSWFPINFLNFYPITTVSQIPEFKFACQISRHSDLELDGYSQTQFNSGVWRECLFHNLRRKHSLVTIYLRFRFIYFLNVGSVTVIAFFKLFWLYLLTASQSLALVYPYKSCQIRPATFLALSCEYTIIYLSYWLAWGTSALKASIRAKLLADLRNDFTKFNLPSMLLDMDRIN